MTSGTPPNTSLVLTEAEISFIDRRYRGRRSQAVHQGLSNLMAATSKNYEGLEVSPHAEQFVAPLRDLAAGHDLRHLSEAIRALEVERMVETLRAHGINASAKINLHACGGEAGIMTHYVLVYAPDEDSLPNAWATVQECRRLIDMVANLPFPEAFRRWRERIMPWESGTYTESDARRDVAAERAELREQYLAGKLSGEDYRIAFSGQAVEAGANQDETGARPAGGQGRRRAGFEPLSLGIPGR